VKEDRMKFDKNPRLSVERLVKALAKKQKDKPNEHKRQG
jgi:hypothetical protein